MDRYSFIILVAGNSNRFFGNKNNVYLNKNFFPTWHKSPLYSLLKKIIKIKEIDDIVFVVNEYANQKKLKINSKITFVMGGKNRWNSSYNGIIKAKNKIIFIHDGARPFLNIDFIKKIIFKINDEKNNLKNKIIVPILKIDDSLKLKKSSKSIKTVDGFDLNVSSV